jgi:hypothetical protein
MIVQPDPPPVVQLSRLLELNDNQQNTHVTQIFSYSNKVIAVLNDGTSVSAKDLVLAIRSECSIIAA